MPNRGPGSQECVTLVGFLRYNGCMPATNDSLGWQQRVVADPQICHGRACIRGTRVMVSAILDGLAAGETKEDVLRSYPALTPLDIDAALAYAAELASERVVFLAGR